MDETVSHSKYVRLRALALTSGTFHGKFGSLVTSALSPLAPTTQAPPTRSGLPGPPDALGTIKRISHTRGLRQELQFDVLMEELGVVWSGEGVLTVLGGVMSLGHWHS